jgi:glycosyltransferase involved in cell wall biosynthesis
MHIVLCHDALIPPPKYGGTERIVYWLAKALIQLEHRVTLIAKPGSAVAGATLLATGAPMPEDADIVHLWGTPSPPPSQPFIVTIQGNGQPGERFHPNTVFISRKHAENHGGTHFVYNGIDPEEYPCDALPARKDHLVFLAKASWKVKNLAGAIEIARAANLPLHVLGSRDWPTELLRRLQRKLPSFGGVRYFGMVGDAEKRQVLRNARALLFPVRWPEPFGIAITEALASGCPVFGTPYGSLPEIITPEVGAVSAEASTLLDLLVNRTYAPEACRGRVLEGFDHLTMADSYLKLYERVQKTGSLSSSPADAPPQARFTKPAETLLPWRGLRS